MPWWLLWKRKTQGADVARLEGWKPGGPSLAQGNFLGVRSPRQALSGIDLSKANLNQADLRRADLEQASLSGAALNHADLRKETLRWANRSNAELVGANLQKANLQDANLSGILTRPNIPEDLKAAKAKAATTNLSGANLQHASLIDADLSGADLSGASLQHAHYSDKTTWPEVQLPHGLLMGRTPVTQGLYRAITGENPAQYKTSNPHPVEKVSWFDAVRFCNALSRVCGLEEAYTIGEGAKPTVSCSFDAQGFRLPTEAEWEYAAKAGQDFEYSGSNDLSEVAWYYSNSVGSRAQSVGQKRPNAWGLYDMSGSVWEWCWDWYDEDEYRNRATLFGDTATMVNSPEGPKTGVDRVLRGGSHSDVSWCLRTSGRSRLVPVKSDWNSGFRLALSYN